MMQFIEMRKQQIGEEYQDFCERNQVMTYQVWL